MNLFSRTTAPPWLGENALLPATWATWPPVAQERLASPPIAPALAQRIRERAAGRDTLDILGTAQDVNRLGHESLLPALMKAKIPAEQPRVRIGSRQCAQPYEASLLNVSALSYGPLSVPFILALNRAARQGGFFQNTGEAGLSPYHLGLDIDTESETFDADAFFALLTPTDLRETGDVVWQLGTGYFGCRQPDGAFDPERFALKARLSPVKMIEIKLSQGVEPWPTMPVKEVTRGMTRLMGIAKDQQAVLQSAHPAFQSASQLLGFVRQLRALSGGKPVGVKLGISHRHYFLALCKAMRKTGVLLDFISVDGMEAGTAAAPGGTLGFTGTALDDALVFVHNALVGTRLREEVRVIASGRVFTECEMVSKLARGADLCATARGWMLAVGCDQQLACNRGQCAQGIATQDVQARRVFPVVENAEKLLNYHRLTIDGLKRLVSLVGLIHPGQLRPCHLQMRVGYGQVLPLDEVYSMLQPGALLSPYPWMLPASYRKAWRQADPEASFLPPAF